MRRTISGLSFALMLVILVAGCAAEPEKVLVGHWGGDQSALAVGIKAAKLKHDMPGASGSEVMAAARAMASIALDLKADKSFELHMPSQVRSGSWSFDKASNLVELTIEPNEAEKQAAAEAARADAERQAGIAAVQAAAQAITDPQADPGKAADAARGAKAAEIAAAPPAAVKPTTWIAEFYPAETKLEIFMGDRESFDYFKKVSEGKKVGLIVLRKQ